MKSKQNISKKKILNSSNPPNKIMAKKRVKKSSKLRGTELVKAIKEAQKDPQFMREIREFIKASTSIYKL